jgi:signal transduction histidine kinase
MAEVSVADTRIGIAPEDRETAFEEFRRVGTMVRQRKAAGSD